MKHRFPGKSSAAPYGVCDLGLRLDFISRNRARYCHVRLKRSDDEAADSACDDPDLRPTQG